MTDLGCENDPDFPYNLGQFVMAWTRFEGEIEMLLGAILRLDRDIYRAVLGNADIRDKLDMLKSAAFTRQLDSEWFDAVDKTVNYIANTLLPLRNRLMHDIYYPERDGFSLGNYKPKIRYAQSRNRVYKPSTRILINSEYLRELRERMTGVTQVMSILWTNFCKKDFSPPFYDRPTLQRHLAHLVEMPRQVALN